MRIYFPFLPAVLAIHFYSSVSLACTFGGARPFSPDVKYEGTDRTGPSSPDVLSVELWSGSSLGSPHQLSSCSRWKTLTITTTATDNETPSEDIGYEIAITEGRPPGELGEFPKRVLASDNTIVFPWIPEDTTEPVAFAFTLQAIDLAGNESAVTKPYVVDSSEGCTCSNSRFAANSIFPPLLLVLFYFIRRRTVTTT